MHIVLFCFSATLCRLIGGAIIRQRLSLLHLFKIVVFKQVWGLYSTFVWWSWKFLKWALTCWKFPGTECWNFLRFAWWDLFWPGDCLLFQSVHKSTLLTRTCSVSSGIQTNRLHEIVRWITSNSYISSRFVSIQIFCLM